MQRKGFKQRAKDLWNYFSTYEKIWFLSILVIAIAFTFIFPETDDGYFTVTFDKTAYATAEGSYDTLVFEGTTGEFTLKTVKINGETVKLAKEAGANVFVSGSYVFKNGDISETIRQLKG